MNKYFIIVALSIFIFSCSDSDEEPKTIDEATSINLPTNASEKVILSGLMSFWMYEGSAGCYGSLTIDISEVNLWVNADSCGEKEYKENESASVEVIYDTSNQYGPGKTYTITSFK